jgi:hypothetical protein
MMSQPEVRPHNEWPLSRLDNVVRAQEAATTLANLRVHMYDSICDGIAVAMPESERNRLADALPTLDSACDDAFAAHNVALQSSRDAGQRQWSAQAALPTDIANAFDALAQSYRKYVQIHQALLGEDQLRQLNEAIAIAERTAALRDSARGSLPALPSRASR